jgi:hypothetical protein
MKGSVPGGLSIYKKEIIKKFLVKNHKAYSFDIWYVTSSSGPLQRLFQQ